MADRTSGRRSKGANPRGFSIGQRSAMADRGPRVADRTRRGAAWGARLAASLADGRDDFGQQPVGPLRGGHDLVLPTTLEDARARVVRTVNSEMVLSCWPIGRELVEVVQGGGPRAGYGEQVFEALSVRLQAAVGRGFSVANPRYFRLFYLQHRARRPEIHHEARDESARKKGASQKRHQHAAVDDGLDGRTTPTAGDARPTACWTNGVAPRRRRSRRGPGGTR